MKVRFLKPKPGMGYFKGSTADLPDDKAIALIEEKYCVRLDEFQKQIISDLPDDLPCRDILINEGLETKEKVLKSSHALNSIKGISDKKAIEIVEKLNIIS